MVIFAANNPEFIVTNKPTQNAPDIVQLLYNIPWTIEAFHPQLKQLTEFKPVNVEKAVFKEIISVVQGACFAQTASTCLCYSTDYLYSLSNLSTPRLLSTLPKS